MDERQFWKSLGIDVDEDLEQQEGEKVNHLEEHEVSMERLQQLFDAAYLECSVDDDGDLKVVTDAGPRVFVSLHEGAKMVRLLALYRLREDVSQEDKLRLVNRMNDDMIFVRFSISENETLVADYYLPYTRGIAPFQIINAIKLMGRIIVSGLRQHDTENYVE